MTPEDYMLRAEFSARDALYPWQAFVGLVALQRNAYLEPGRHYVIDASRTKNMKDLGQAVVMHPDDVEALRLNVGQQLGREASENELAAVIFYFAMKKYAEGQRQA